MTRRHKLKMKNFYTYIITNEARRPLYVGVTNDLARRIYEHKHEVCDGFSKRYHLHKLVYYELHSNAKTAIEREKKLKQMRREKKFALILSVNPAWNDLSQDISFSS